MLCQIVAFKCSIVHIRKMIIDDKHCELSASCTWLPITCSSTSTFAPGCTHKSPLAACTLSCTVFCAPTTNQLFQCFCCSRKESPERLPTKLRPSQGCKRILILANDTNILGISFFTEIGAEKLWISFGMGKKMRYIPIHNLCDAISPAKAQALPALHAT